jgi:chromosome segregation ATPase
MVLGTNGEVKSAFKEINGDEISPSTLLSSAELRDRFVERRGILRQLQGEIASQGSRIRSLQQDADNIAMVSKIVDAEDELGEIKARLKRVSTAQSDLDRRVSQMRARPQPLNAKKREAELVEQLSELSTALSATENQAIKKISGAKGALEDKLRLIEETKGEHISLLEEELARARKGR